MIEYRFNLFYVDWNATTNQESSATFNVDNIKTEILEDECTLLRSSEQSNSSFKFSIENNDSCDDGRLVINTSKSDDSERDGPSDQEDNLASLLSTPNDNGIRIEDDGGASENNCEVIVLTPKIEPMNEDDSEGPSMMNENSFDHPDEWKVSLREMLSSQGNCAKTTLVLKRQDMFQPSSLSTSSSTYVPHQSSEICVVCGDKASGNVGCLSLVSLFQLTYVC